MAARGARAAADEAGGRYLTSQSPATYALFPADCRQGLKDSRLC